MDILRPTEPTAIFNVDRRLEQVAKLRRNLSLRAINPAEYTGTRDTTPTIGIEVEMSWMQAFPELGDEWINSSVRPSELDRRSLEFKEFKKRYNAHENQLLPNLLDVKNVIPRVGIDAYWEFSFNPSRHVGVTLAEVQTLYDAHILYDGIPYATHMTVASIDNDRDAFAFLCGLELSGGSTRERILTAISTKKGAWSRKGSGGLRQRRPYELIGSDNDAYEFRTLVASSSTQISSLLLTASELAHTYQNDPVAWKAYRRHIESRLKSAGLELKAWSHPKNDSTPWLKYAELLEK